MKFIFSILLLLLLSGNAWTETCRSLFEKSNLDSKTKKHYRQIKNIELILDCKTMHEMVDSTNLLYKGHKRLCVLELDSINEPNELALFFGQSGFGLLTNAENMERASDQHALFIKETNKRVFPGVVSYIEFLAKGLFLERPTVTLKIFNRSLPHKKEVLLDAEYECSIEN